MKTIDLIGIMKTVATVTPLEGENEFLVKYGNHKQVVIVVKEAAQHSVQADGLCPNCRRDYFENETILPNGELGCNCAAANASR